jgi:hypothetical protein
MEDFLEWLEGHVGKVCLLLIFFGVVAFAAGVAALFGVLKPEFSPLWPLIGGPAAVVVGIGLYRRHLWAILVALLLCLGVTAAGCFAVASDRRPGGVDAKDILGGVFFVGCDLALLVLLAGKVAAKAEVPGRVGVVEAMGPGLQCLVRLGGDPVVASIPRKLAWSLSRVVPGDQVRVAGSLQDGYRVLAFPEKRA